MAENENIVLNEDTPAEQPEKKGLSMKKIGAGLKEWGRKQIVTLKRYPHRIPLFCFVIVSVLWLLWLFTFSQTIYKYQAINWTGLSVFVITLLEILILPLFLNAFPKRSKPNVVFIALVFVFVVAIILLDVLYYSQVHLFVFGDGTAANPPQVSADVLAGAPYIENSLTLSIVHIVLMAVCAVVLALLPVYSKLIKKINTRKDIETTEIKENIDVEEDE